MPEFYVTFARKMPDFLHDNCPKNTFPDFWEGSTCTMPGVSDAYCFYLFLVTDQVNNDDDDDDERGGVTYRDFHVFEGWRWSAEWRIIRASACLFNEQRIILIVARSSWQHNQHRLERVHHLFHHRLERVHHFFHQRLHVYSVHTTHPYNR